MAQRNNIISDEMQLSLRDLSEELKSLGIKSDIKKDSSETELCEALLNTTWLLINLIHSNAMGLKEPCRNTCNRELLLTSEKQSLEIKLDSLQSKVNKKDKIINEEKQKVLRRETELKEINEAFLKQKKVITSLTAQSERQERDFKLQSSKLEAVNEDLREMVRKSIGVAHHPLSVERLGDILGSASVSSGELSAAEETTLNRLKSANQTLVGENLMLRDALKWIHQDISRLVSHRTHTKDEDIEDIFGLQDSIFTLPLSRSMKKVKEIRLHQISQLNNIMQKYDSN